MIKIYKIIDNTNNNVYVGSTKVKLLTSRISQHKNDFKNNRYLSSSIILINNDWRYELIEECDESIRYEREKYHINNTDNCINERDFNYTKKRWVNQNKDHVISYQKEYDKKNKVKAHEYYLLNIQKRKEYNMKNKEKQKEYKRKYHLLKTEINRLSNIEEDVFS